MLGHMVYDGRDFGEEFFCHAPRVLPQSAISEMEVGGRNGAYYKSRKLRPVDIACTMVLRDAKPDQDGMASLMHEVAADLLAPEQARLYLPSHENRYYIATVKEFSSIDEFVTSARVNVVFHACDPVMHGDEHVLEVPASKTTLVRPGGNMPSFPVATATAVSGLTFYRLRNTTAGEQVYVYPNGLDTTNSWNGGEQIKVDMQNQVAYVNGQVWPVSLSSDYFSITGGEGGGSNIWANMATTLAWEERWL